jgi:STE24 endopeptidase
MIQLNLLLLAYLAVSLFRTGLQAFLHWLNISHLRRHGTSVPEPFKETVSLEQFKRISDYTAVSARFEMIAHLADQVLLLAILLSGFLPCLTQIIQERGWGFIPGGLVFFAALGVLENVFRAPINLYDTFVIEARFGFNTRTLRTWLLDWIKNLAVVAVVGGTLLACLLALIFYAGSAWWLWAWVAVGLFEILMLWLFPVVIAPLFNKFEPVEDESLEQQIRSLMEKAGLHVKGVLKMDASRRSRHTNAYFTGIGRNKRIVLFDTLLGSHRGEEILAILAHEIAHWKKKHVLKQIVLMEILSLALFFIVAQLMDWQPLYRTFGFQQPVLFAGLLLAGAILSPLGFMIQPVGAAISRKFEREADDYAVELMQAAEPMQSALKRLAIDNLANLSPHPLYAWFYYSHPPLGERIARLGTSKIPNPKS